MGSLTAAAEERARICSGFLPQAFQRAPPVWLESVDSGRPELGSSGHPSRHRTSVQVPILNFLPSCVHLLPPPPCCSRAQRCHCCRNEYCFDGLLLRDFKLGVAVHFGVFPDDCTDLNFEQKGVPSQPCLLQSSPVDNPLGPSASGQIISLGLSVNYQ